MKYNPIPCYTYNTRQCSLYIDYIFDTYLHSLIGIYVTLCAIWYYLNNLKNVKNTHGGVLLLVKLQASGFRLSRFLNRFFQRIKIFFVGLYLYIVRVKLPNWVSNSAKLLQKYILKFTFRSKNLKHRAPIPHITNRQKNYAR